MGWQVYFKKKKRASIRNENIDAASIKMSKHRSAEAAVANNERVG